MQNKLIKIAKDNELFLKKFVETQKKTDLIAQIKRSCNPKRIRSKI